jgi:hypothetical protein
MEIILYTPTLTKRRGYVVVPLCVCAMKKAPCALLLYTRVITKSKALKFISRLQNSVSGGLSEHSLARRAAQKKSAAHVTMPQEQFLGE